VTKKTQPRTTPLGTSRKVAGSVFEVSAVPDAPTPRVEKRVARHLAHDAEARAALAREAGFLALASHPSLPRLYAVRDEPEGLVIVEEAVEGRTLEQLVDDRDARFPQSLARTIVRDAARSLQEVHALSDKEGPLDLFHGDPSFANLVVAPEGRVRFVDFGEAGYRGAPPRSVVQAGTPPYAAPELLRGESAPSQATDVYALGAVALALLTGAPLRPEREAAARLLKLAEVGIDLAPLAASDLAPDLRTALASVVAFAPRERMTSLDGLIAALGA
jgi:serine/threonine protein kinase